MNYPTEAEIEASRNRIEQQRSAPTRPLRPPPPPLPRIDILQHNRLHDEQQQRQEESGWSEAGFRAPRRAIGSQSDLDHFLSCWPETSPGEPDAASDHHRHDTPANPSTLGGGAYGQLVGFVTRLAQSVQGVKLTAPCHESQVAKGLLELLETVHGWVAEIPPATDHSSRFGNPAFRQWMDRLAERGDALLNTLILVHLPAEIDEPARQAVVSEIREYLLSCWGDRQRIDYGTGHETHFIAFLLCLERIGLVTSEDYQALVLRVFNQYIKVMRALQLAYWLEPAGSHGVWGLDDYHFLPFLFGSSQLIEHRHIKPKSILYAETCDAFAKEYMYLACIKFVNEVKTETLAWHSPMLYDISSVKTWAKVHEGMLKMYRKEVLGKLPIMQHFRFGSLIYFNAFDFIEFGDEHADECHDDAHGHGHSHSHGQDVQPVFHEHATCCISHLPSAIAAKAHSTGLRSIPFD
ncbi:serine/threonine-protein phosphatase 2A activator 2 [Capsaspora owczarzaki ATCC 30864]|uniref:Serine/threonine-protein phosphatase 2A activator n=1 Tax=Capsaspora owczarzaki (strain ATCC 30864) TaxID=595528 RepID=A0A0D2X2F2_CAPO3|nr:serine/threonine-protein phosphatase 2A activator 2 [Capsaspora owczarzaki ATCC 30864]KJE92454.1 serine/threonine-protein phosphatase 2A activator 2 [Capsaspora owczarzaki ATCC 30864]|eukprot:XP_004364266.2 serine/threonine-protein phosphatase 2A activator 2 [Capsaspora owczarzaki ATCC 30864]